MFVIENLLNDYQRKLSVWEHARDKWVNDPKYEDHYRDARTYERNHPRPTNYFSVIGKSIAIGVCVGLVGVLLFGFAKEIANRPDKPKEQVKAVTYKNGDDCGKYHIGDLGTVNYGDYEGAEVKITGGCKDNEDYEVVTVKDQTLFAEGSEHPAETDKNIKAGLTFKVDSSSNLSITGHSKE